MDSDPKACSVLSPSTVTILASYRCNAACDNCCFGSNPSITQRIEILRILSFIDEAASLGTVQLVVFSGGECFLLGDDLIRAVEHATTRGLKTRCVTNGYWAKSLEHGRKRLGALKRAGLSEINVSTGDVHQQWVNEDCVVHAAMLGVELAFKNTLIMVELHRSRRVTAAKLMADPRVEALLAQAKDGGSPFRIIESPWMPMDEHEVADQPAANVLSRHTLHLKGGCDSVLTTMVLTPSGDVGLCCGLSRELIPELNSAWVPGRLAGIVDVAGRDFMRIWLLVDGPERILAWAASIEPRIAWENRYAHHCHACLGLFRDPLVRQTIREHYTDRIEDVLMRYSLLLRHQEVAQGAVYN